MSKRTSQSKIQNILPELHLLLRASIDDQRYHRVTFDTLEALRKLLTENQGILNVKRKAGCLSYKDDPQGTIHILRKHLYNPLCFDKIFTQYTMGKMTSIKGSFQLW